MKADAQNEIDRIDVYAINFTKTSKYGLTEKEIRQPENLQLKIDEISRNLEVMLSPYVGLRECVSSSKSDLESVDLRMVCVVNMKDGSEWTLGFSYMDYMTFIGKVLKPRNDQILLALSRLIEDKKIRKSIENDVKLNKK